MVFPTVKRCLDSVHVYCIGFDKIPSGKEPHIQLMAL